MQKPSERHKLTSDNNMIKFKMPVHDPFKKSELQDFLRKSCEKKSELKDKKSQLSFKLIYSVVETSFHLKGPMDDNIMKYFFS